MYEAIKQFLKPPSEGGAYTDERLAMLLAHAEDGKLTLLSCCCLIGIPTADHALQGENDYLMEPHYSLARTMYNSHSGLVPAEGEFQRMSDLYGSRNRAAERRAKLIPLIKEEMERRSRLSLETEDVGREVLALTLK